MSDTLARWIFWVGTLVSLAVLLGLTVDTHRQVHALSHADRLDDQVVAGKRAFERYNCNDCHTILGFGAYYAPDLTRAHSRIGESGIRRRLVEPQVAFADSFRKMPRQHVSDADVMAMTAYLRWTDGVENHDWPPQDSAARWKRSTERLLASAAMSPGAALIAQENCLGCHSLGSAGQRVGGRLEWIGSRRSADWIADYLAEPGRYQPNIEMPAFNHLTRDQRLTIAAFVAAAATGRGR
jgi:nitric oxide reductase subunit C